MTGEADAEARRERSPTIAREERIERGESRNSQRQQQEEGRWYGEGRAGDKSAELPMELVEPGRGGRRGGAEAPGK